MNQKALLLIPGFLSDYTDFNNISSFIKDNYEYYEYVVHPGHSGIDIESNYNLFECDETIKNVEEIFDRIHEKYPIIDVIGYSMGGALATYLSKNRPINKLVLLAPANHYLNPVISISKLKFLADNFKGYINNKNDKEARKLYKMMIDNSFVDDKTGVKFFVNKYFHAYILKAYKEFRKVIAKCNENLELITCPTLIMWGKLDQLVPRKSVEELYKKAVSEQSKLVIFDNFTHLMLNSVAPQQLIDELTGFLV